MTMASSAQRVLVAVLVICIATAVSFAAAPSRAVRSASPDLVRFEDEIGPESFTLTITRDGRASLTNQGPAPPIPRTFTITSAELGSIKTELASARLSEARPTYGIPNPGGFFEVVTANGRSVTLYGLPAPPMLLKLMTTLERIVATQKDSWPAGSGAYAGDTTGLFAGSGVQLSTSR
jgi:hypothetical protein